MGTLRAWLAAVGLLLATPAQANAIERWESHIEEASARFGIPVEWIQRVMHAESRGQTSLNGRPIVSRAGAMGLMQLMPGTWAAMRAQLGLGRDPHQPRDNILAGTYYLRLMYDRFGYPGLFAAYNAGPGRYRAYLAGARRLPSETIAYMAATATASMPRNGEEHRMAPPRALDTVFFAGADRPATSLAPAASRLFFVLSRSEGEVQRD